MQKAGRRNKSEGKIKTTMKKIKNTTGKRHKNNALSTTGFLCHTTEKV